MSIFSLHQIGVVRSCFPEKFGIPRQAGLAPSARATIEMVPPFNRLEMFRGLACFSHIWVHFIFHQAVNDGWKSTVRPPRLGGKQRLGIFATRSPHRPSFLGLSVVELRHIRAVQNGVTLEVAGIDLLDQTPVVDIKPYLPYSDAIEHAGGGRLAKAGCSDMRVIFSDQAQRFCRSYEEKTGKPLQQLIEELLEQDPRPANQKHQKTAFGMALWELNIRWRVQDSKIFVISCREQVAGDR